MAVSCDVAVCCLADVERRFGGASCLRYQGDRPAPTRRNIKETAAFILVVVRTSNMAKISEVFHNNRSSIAASCPPVGIFLAAVGAAYM
jgi:hypothetical protein